MTTLDRLRPIPAADVKADALVVARRRGPATGPVARRRPTAWTAGLRTAWRAALPAVGAGGAAERGAPRCPSLGGVAAPVVVARRARRRRRRGDARVRRRGAAPRRRRRGPRADRARERSALALPGDDARVGRGRRRGRRCSARTPSRGYRGRRPSAKTAGRSAVVVLAPTAAATDAAEPPSSGPASVAEAVHSPATWSTPPPNDLYPAELRRRRRRAAAAGSRLAVEVLDEKALARGRLRRHPRRRRRARSRPPRLVRISLPRRPAPRAHLALVGKGITFDSGGLSLKPAAGMDDDEVRHGRRRRGHRRDRRASPQLGLAGRRHRLACRSPRTCRRARAYRPADVLTHVRRQDRRGRSTPTPRAGWSWPTRIVAAAEDEPDALVDVATLTGAQRGRARHRGSSA